MAAGLLAQIVMARLLGAGADLDAFFAALALPQYMVTVLTGALIPVIVPVMASVGHRFGPDQSRRVGQALAFAVLPATAVLTLAGIVASGPLLDLTAPGLSPAVHGAAVRMAWILWPILFGSTAVAVATGIANSTSRFLWPAIVPFFGGILNILLLFLLVRRFGAYAAAVAMTVAIVFQALLFAPLLTRGWEPTRDLMIRSELLAAWSLVWPLLASGFFSRITIVAERFFGSTLAPGTVAEISYASRLIAPLSVLISTGIATALFPRLARMSAEGDFDALGRSIARSVRALWIVIAPVTIVGIVLARPVVGVVFEGGKFTASDADGVARLLQIYLGGIAAAVLGMITARVFYALKRVRLLSLMSVIEAVAYVGYTGMLVSRFGASGVAIGYVIYLSASIVWHVALIRRWIHWTLLLPTLLSIARTTGAAAIGAAGAFLVVGRLQGEWAQILAGGSVAVVIFAGVLPLLNRTDFRLIIESLRELLPAQ
jgi:putative peptidoglycan lipid II flippase